VIAALGSAGRVLAVGIGGGGDVVGALVVRELAGLVGTPAVVGGLTWERRPIDPLPGPRRIDELRDARRLNDAAALAGPDTSGPGEFLFAESHVARHLGEPTLLLDPTGGPAAVAAGLAGAARELGCDVVVLVDVGGDVLGHGDEPGLASPLADALLLAAARHLPSDLRVLLGVFGAGCDGELTLDEVGKRVAEVAARGGWLGAMALDPEQATVVEAAVAEVPTEASAMAVRAARGATGTTTIRQGRRTVELSPMAALTFYLDPLIAMDTAARLADAVVDAPSLEKANAILRRLGVRSELDYETDMQRA
jgi:hypothetical protein